MPSHDEHPAHEAPVSAARYYKSRVSRGPVVYVQEEEHWRVYADGRLTRESTGAIPASILARSEEINQAEAERLIELERARAQEVEAERAEAQKAQEKQARESARFNAKVLIIVAVVLAAVCAAGVSGYLYIGMPSVDPDDLVSATVSLLVSSRTLDLDLSDPAMREEVAGLLNGLVRWWGRDYECAWMIELEVRVRGGSVYSICANCAGQLKLWIGDRSMWVKSDDMMRFLKRYYEQYR